MDNHASLAERRAALLQAAAQVGRAVTSILDPDELLVRTVDIICDEFGFYYAGVFLIDESGEWAVLRAGRGEPGRAMVVEGHRLRIDGHSMIGAATGRRQALIALDVGEEPVHFRNPHLPHTRSEMALPLLVGGRLIGALTVQSIEEAAFTPDDITVLQTMADQLAVAIDNAWLHAENRRLLVRAERRARLLGAAAEVGRDVASILDLDTLLSKTVDIICEVYGFYYAGVFLVDESGEWAVLRAGRGAAGAAMLAEGHRLKVGGHSMIGAATAQRRARIALDVGEEAVHFRNPHLPRTRSEMALPLLAGDQIIGALTVQSIDEAAFSDDDITSLQSMADLLAVAIDNARLLRDLEAAHAELVRTKTFEAIATATTEAIHWIGNKALPISGGVARLRQDLDAEPVAGRIESMLEDLALIEDSAALIVAVQEHLIGPAREDLPRPAMVDDLLKDTLVRMGVPVGAVAVSAATDLPLVRADTTQLGRAFEYVLKNALEAIEEADERAVAVEIAPTDESVAVRVLDSGPGIPPKEMDKIWAAFYTTKGAQHAGLGLSACVQIMDQIEGRISAANRPEGGAVFELCIPLFDGPLPGATLPTGQAILLIDDADRWSDFAAAVLIEAGNTVARSADGRTDPAPFDVILIDDVLEGADCLQVLEQLSPAAPVTVVASSLRVERAMELVQRGARDTVLKPYTATGLAAILAPGA